MAPDLIPVVASNDTTSATIILVLKQPTTAAAVIMNNQTEGIISSLTATLILFISILNPYVSVGLAVLFLIDLSIYTFRAWRRSEKHPLT